MEWRTCMWINDVHLSFSISSCVMNNLQKCSVCVMCSVNPSKHVCGNLWATHNKFIIVLTSMTSNHHENMEKINKNRIKSSNKHQPLRHRQSFQFFSLSIVSMTLNPIIITIIVCKKRSNVDHQQ